MCDYEEKLSAGFYDLDIKIPIEEQRKRLDEAIELFKDLEPLDPFDIKKEEINANLIHVSVYNGKGNRIKEITDKTTVKELFQQIKDLGYELDIGFRRKHENPSPLPFNNRIPIGTKIRAIKRVTEDACGDHPALLYAEIGEEFIIDHYNDDPGDYVFKTK